MNRLLAFKKSKASAQPSSPAPVDTTPTTTPDSIEKRSWRRKKPVTIPKPDIDVRNVLPSSEQFRTSLIMPNLSARFSMLREQDDPNSVIGKASDDSVLQPKRKSRLADFGAAAGMLSDIAEVSSIVDSIRPTAPAPRKTSYTYGERTPTKTRSSMEESIMNRARGDFPPNGGNVSPRRSPRHSPRNSPRRTTPKKKSIDMLNDEPPKISPFKQYLRKEELEDFKRQHHMYDETWAQQVLASPKLSFDDGKRQTNSSTGSGPSIASFSTAPTSSSPLSSSMSGMTETPATTTTSSPAMPSAESAPGMSSMKPDLQRKQSQRLYGQSLAMHTSDQRSAALGRLTSIRRNPSMLQRSGTVNIHCDNDESGEPARRMRPPMEKLTTFDSIRRPRLASPESEEPTSPAIQSPPLSPFDEMAENNNPLYNHMNANERGKATALGLFSKPEKFNERQYLQRQLSLMQQQRPKRMSALSPRKPTFPSKTSPSKSPMKSSPRRGKPPMPRRGTDASDASWEASDDVFSTAQTGIEEGEHLQANSAVDSNDIKENIPETVEEEAEPAEAQNTWASHFQVPAVVTPQNHEATPSLSDHPALRSTENSRARRNGWSPERLMAAKSASSSPEELWPTTNDENSTENQDSALKSPKLVDLKGLVGNHLRHHSNASSIYPSHNHVQSMYMNNWDSSEDFDKLMQRGFLPSTVSSSHLSVRPSPQSARRQPSNVTLRDLVAEEENQTGSPDPSREIRQHARGGSSETQHERRAFKDELAQRQRTIQENLKIKVENDSRPPVPAISSRSPLELPLKPFAMLKAKTSRDSLLPSKNVETQSNRAYKWVDMSAGDAPNAKLESKDAIYKREPLSPGFGRTLHSKLKPAEEVPPRVRKQEKPSLTKNDAAADSSADDLSRSSKEDLHLGRPSEDASKIQATSQPRSSNDRSRISPDSSSSPVLASASTPPPIATSTPARPALPPPPRPSPPKPTLTINTSLPSPSLPPLPPPKAAHRPAPPPPRPAPRLQTKSSQAQLLRRRAHAYTQQLQLPSHHFHNSNTANNGNGGTSPQHENARTHHQAASWFKKTDISEPTLLASTFPGDTVDLPKGASLKNGMRSPVDDVDQVLSARQGQGASSPLGQISGNKRGQMFQGAVAMGRSVSAGIVKEEREKERENQRMGARLQPFLARVGRSVSADKERIVR